jgi:hypothetical protein
MSKTLENVPRSRIDPADRHFTITPDDDADLSIVPRAIRVGGAGNVVIRDGAGTDVTYAVTAGEVLTFRPVRVLDTGTTATGLVGWY